MNERVDLKRCREGMQDWDVMRTAQGSRATIDQNNMVPFYLVNRSAWRGVLFCMYVALSTGHMRHLLTDRDLFNNRKA